jgi:hypothetical protein
MMKFWGLIQLEIERLSWIHTIQMEIKIITELLSLKTNSASIGIATLLSPSHNTGADAPLPPSSYTPFSSSLLSHA